MIKIAGIILIILGVCSIAWGGFNYRTKEKVVDIGPIQATHEKTHHIPVTPLAGGLALVAGIGLVVSRKV
jgi:UDP-N-acetylmuramyl pentapeptide phosphotransferase/UDP-N-acetylglucosamine-1-phosphate transferase